MDPLPSNLQIEGAITQVLDMNRLLSAHRKPQLLSQRSISSASKNIVFGSKAAFVLPKPMGEFHVPVRLLQKPEKQRQISPLPKITTSTTKKREVSKKIHVPFIQSQTETAKIADCSTVKIEYEQLPTSAEEISSQTVSTETDMKIIPEERSMINTPIEERSNDFKNEQTTQEDVDAEITNFLTKLNETQISINHIEEDIVIAPETNVSGRSTFDESKHILLSSTMDEAAGGKDLSGIEIIVQQPSNSLTTKKSDFEEMEVSTKLKHVSKIPNPGLKLNKLKLAAAPAAEDNLLVGELTPWENEGNYQYYDSASDSE